MRVEAARLPSSAPLYLTLSSTWRWCVRVGAARLPSSAPPYLTLFSTWRWCVRVGTARLPSSAPPYLTLFSTWRWCVRVGASRLSSSAPQYLTLFSTWRWCVRVGAARLPSLAPQSPLPLALPYSPSGPWPKSEVFKRTLMSNGDYSASWRLPSRFHGSVRGYYFLLCEFYENADLHITLSTMKNLTIILHNYLLIIFGDFLNMRRTWWLYCKVVTFYPQHFISDVNRSTQISRFEILFILNRHFLVN